MDSAKALEELFNSASAMDSMDEADGAGVGGFANSEFPGASGVFDVDEKGNATEDASKAGSNTLTLKQYIQSFDQDALAEGGEPITSPDQLMSRVQDVVGGGKVKTLTLPVATQRRVVLEAVAFGTFLRDAETYVDTRDGRLLTPVSR